MTMNKREFFIALLKEMKNTNIHNVHTFSSFSVM